MGRLGFFHEVHWNCPLQGFSSAEVFSVTGAPAKVREEGEGKSSVLEQRHIKLHQALH